MPTVQPGAWSDGTPHQNTATVTSQAPADRPSVWVAQTANSSANSTRPWITCHGQSIAFVVCSITGRRTAPPADKAQPAVGRPRASSSSGSATAAPTNGARPNGMS
jgi:hypothetical protein